MHTKISPIAALAAMAFAFVAGWSIAELRTVNDRTRMKETHAEYVALVEASQIMAQKSLDHSVKAHAELADCVQKLRTPDLVKGR